MTSAAGSRTDDERAGERSPARMTPETARQHARAAGAEIVQGAHLAFRTHPEHAGGGHGALGTRAKPDMDANGLQRGATHPALAALAASLIGPRAPQSRCVILDAGCGTGVMGAAAAVELATRPSWARPENIECRLIDCNDRYTASALETFAALTTWGRMLGVEIVARAVTGDIFDTRTWRDSETEEPGRTFSNLKELTAGAQIVAAAAPPWRIKLRSYGYQVLENCGVKGVSCVSTAMLAAIFNAARWPIETVAVTTPDWTHLNRHAAFRSRLRAGGTVTDVHIVPNRAVRGADTFGTLERGADTFVWRYAPGPVDHPTRVVTHHGTFTGETGHATVSTLLPAASIFDPAKPGRPHAPNRFRPASTRHDAAMGRLLQPGNGDTDELQRTGLRVFDGILSPYLRHRNEGSGNNPNNKAGREIDTEETAASAPDGHWRGHNRFSRVARPTDAALVTSGHVRFTGTAVAAGCTAVTWPLETPDAVNGYDPGLDAKPSLLLEPGWYVALAGPQIGEPGTTPLAALITPETTGGRRFTTTRLVLLIGRTPVNREIPGIGSIDRSEAVLLVKWLNSAPVRWHLRKVCRRTGPKGIDLQETPVPVGRLRKILTAAALEGRNCLSEEWGRRTAAPTRDLLETTERIQRAGLLIAGNGPGLRPAADELSAACLAALCIEHEQGHSPASTAGARTATERLLGANLGRAGETWIRETVIPDLVTNGLIERSDEDHVTVPETDTQTDLHHEEDVLKNSERNASKEPGGQPYRADRRLPGAAILIEEATRADGFGVRRSKGGYTSLFYHYVNGEADQFDFPRSEMRGLVIGPDDEIEARPFQKFWNWNERGAAGTDWTEPHIVQPKLDGSLVYPAHSDPSAWFTRGGRTDTSAVAEAIWNRAALVQAVVDRLTNGGGDHEASTPLFELIGPSNRIIIDYPEDRLVLLAVREIESGSYWTPSRNLQRMLGGHRQMAG